MARARTVKFEVGNGLHSWAYGEQVFAVGEHVLENAPADLLDALGCAAAAGIGVTVLEGAEYPEVGASLESDEDSLAFQERVRAECVAPRPGTEWRNLWTERDSAIQFGMDLEEAERIKAEATQAVAERLRKGK